jgi:hypothetical protein
MARSLPARHLSDVWGLIENARADGRAISPREVFVELTRKDDEVAAWAKQRSVGFVEPTEGVQRESGVIYSAFPNPGIRDARRSVGHR